MGYLNYNLEKVASVIEVEMEKQALKLGDLARMGRTAATRGKALHFANRLKQRNRALNNRNNIKSRNDQYYAADAKLGDAAYMERAYGTTGPANRELARLQGRRIPDTSRVVSEATLVSPHHGGLTRAQELLNTRHVPVDSVQLSNVVRNLRKGWGTSLV